MIYYIITPLVIFLINFFIKKNKLIINDYQLNHQKLANTKVPLSGGYFLIIPIILIFYKVYPLFTIIGISIFLLGIFSDLNILISPKKRFIIQFFLILIFVFTKQLEVLPSRINYIDEIFLNTYWSYFFTIFCLMILINGSNFVDGLNGLLLGYLLIIIIIIYKLNFHISLNITSEQINFLIYLFFIVLCFNILNQFFLGDSGAYFLSFFTGFILIEIFNTNLKNISPYFIILLLWYPCFENLFSILRKLNKNKSALKPDNEHLHQSIFIFLRKKFRLKNLTSNILSAVLINSFNLVLLFIGSLDPFNTMFQLILISCAILSYVVTYFLLKKNFSI